MPLPESSIVALEGRVTKADHVVYTASARARAGNTDSTASLVKASASAKVSGPILLAKHFAGAYHALGEERNAVLFKARPAANPARRP